MTILEAPVAPARPVTPRNPTADKLLAAASALMIERNSIDISLSDLAQKSGVNAALVKYHFGNKDGLLLALLARDAAGEMTALNYLIVQKISATEKLKLHIAGIINAYYRFPYLNRLIHLLLHQSNQEAANEVAKFFIRPLFEFQRRLLEEGERSGEFRKVDPVLFYTMLVGACDHLFHGRSVMSQAIGVGEVDDEVRQQYIAHVTQLCIGGITRPHG
jgi:AcrR family transcriptional regulator